jgi:prepilin-type processing-associated H-X9-DG protein/prepilin-type N-terminal cleavage/methylation domain-containing protein
VSRSRSHQHGFPLLELLTVIGIVAILSALLFPVLGRARGAAQSAACMGNLRQMQSAYTMYLSDHDGRFFRYSEGDPNASLVLYYYGLSSKGAEGSRRIDKSKAKLAPYLGQIGGVETCPSLPYRAPYFKQKYEIASYGYGINVNLLADGPGHYCSISQVTRPAETIAWGDAIQINIFQAPASPEHPMLEEFYWLDIVGSPKYHFRHNGRCNVVMMDGSVRSFRPERLDQRCDGLSGYIEPIGEDYYLRPIK